MVAINRDSNHSEFLDPVAYNLVEEDCLHFSFGLVRKLFRVSATFAALELD